MYFACLQVAHAPEIFMNMNMSISTDLTNNIRQTKTNFDITLLVIFESFIGCLVWKI